MPAGERHGPDQPREKHGGGFANRPRDSKMTPTHRRGDSGTVPVEEKKRHCCSAENSDERSPEEYSRGKRGREQRHPGWRAIPAERAGRAMWAAAIPGSREGRHEAQNELQHPMISGNLRRLRHLAEPIQAFRRGLSPGRSSIPTGPAAPNIGRALHRRRRKRNTPFLLKKSGILAEDVSIPKSEEG